MTPGYLLLLAALLCSTASYGRGAADDVLPAKLSIGGNCIGCVGGVVGKTLLGKAFLGEPCQASSECEEDVSNAECNPETKTCVCKPQYIPPPDDNSSCNRLAEVIGDWCGDDPNQCTSIANSSCFISNDNYYCDCLAGFVESGAGNKCLPIQELGSPCEESRQCSYRIQYAECNAESKTCACEDGTFSPPEVSDQCIRLSGFIGAPCEEHPLQCQNLTGSFCQGEPGSRKCGCFETFVGSDDGRRCLLKADLVGDSCEESTQCEANLGEYSYCFSNNTCQCHSDSKPSEDMSTCLKTVRIGESCSSSEECVGSPMESSWCSAFSSTCECLEGFVAARERDDCLPIRNQLNETCVEDSQCTLGALGDTTACVDGRCACRDGFPYVDGECRRPAGLGEVCHSDEECQLGNQHSYCAANDPTHDYRCKCIPGSVETPEGSCALRGIGDECDTDEDCTMSISGQVECNSCARLCVCKTGHVFRRGDSYNCIPEGCRVNKFYGA